MRKDLEAKIDALPPRLRIVFVLCALEGLSVAETAAALGIPEAAVETHFFRARSRLPKVLSREMDEAFSFEGERCDRMVARVVETIGSGT